MGVIRKDLPVFVSTFGKNQKDFGITVFEQPDFDHSPPVIAEVIMEPNELICLAKELIDLANAKADQTGGEWYQISSFQVPPVMDNSSERV